MTPHFQNKETGESIGFGHPTDDEWAATLHQRAAMEARAKHLHVVEVADEQGEPCKGLPHEYNHK